MAPSEMELCKGILQSMAYWIFILKVWHIGQFFWKVGLGKKKFVYHVDPNMLWIISIGSYIQ